MGAIEIRSRTTTVHTVGSTTITALTVLTEAIDGRKAGKCRPAVEIVYSSGALEARIFAQTSDDGVTWSAAATLTGYTGYGSAAGWTYGSTFATLTEAPFVRFGLEARNSSGTKIEAARCSLILDLTFD